MEQLFSAALERLVLVEALDDAVLNFLPGLVLGDEELLVFVDAVGIAEPVILLELFVALDVAHEVGDLVHSRDGGAEASEIAVGVSNLVTEDDILHQIALFGSHLRK